MKTLIIGSSTRTIKAQEVLQRYGIAARIKRLDSTEDGCVRGLQLEDGQLGQAVKLLAGNDIPVRGIVGGGR